MNLRVLIGSLLAFVYNEVLSRFPSRHTRNSFLSWWTGGFGKGTNVQMGCRFLNARKVFFGKNNVINFGCFFDGRHFPIHFGDNVSIGPEAAILTLGHDPMSSGFENKGGEVRVGDRVWIGYRAIILPGIEIGEGAVVGAGAVVTKDVPPYTIVAGNPARKIADRSRELDYTLDFRPPLI